MYKEINNILNKIKQIRPVILNITNYVTMDFIANGLLSLGASPIMIKAINEVQDLVKIANGVVINIGTLDDEFVSLCEQVCTTANKLKKPILLDPVGAGASNYRTTICLDFINKFKFSAIKGNASEIMALYNSSINTKAIDSSLETEQVINAAKHLSLQLDTIIAISGKTDAIVNKDKYVTSTYGSPFMPMITGSGCLLTAVISAFHAVSENYYEATIAAINYYGLAGEHAATQSHGSGSFKVNFLDQLAIIPEK